MCPETTALRHNAFVYDALDTYVERSVAFLRDGLQNGEGAVVANTRAGIAAMRDALGVDADEVTFVDVSAAYTRPAKTLAAYHRVYARQLASTGSLRAVAEVQFGPHPAEWDMWTGYEAVFNRAFAHLPAWVLCSYNADAIPDAVLEGVWKTHPQVLVNDDWSSGDHYVDPDAILRESTADPAVLSGLRPIAVGEDLEQFRERLARELVAAKVAEASVLDMLVAATEVAKNALTHGGGIQVVRVGVVDGRFVCEIVDRGRGFEDPAAGYLAPRQGVGAGLWVARQLTWHIEFARGPDGFAARIWL